MKDEKHFWKFQCLELTALGARMALFILHCSPRSAGAWIMNLYPAPHHRRHNYLSTLLSRLAHSMHTSGAFLPYWISYPILSYTHSTARAKSFGLCLGVLRHAGAFCHKTLCFTNRRTPESERQISPWRIKKKRLVNCVCHAYRLLLTQSERMLYRGD